MGKLGASHMRARKQSPSVEKQYMEGVTKLSIWPAVEDARELYLEGQMGILGCPEQET